MGFWPLTLSKGYFKGKMILSDVASIDAIKDNDQIKLS